MVRKKRVRIEDLPLPEGKDLYVAQLAKALTRQIDREVFQKKYAPVADILKLVGAGVFLGAAIVFPTLPQIVKPFFNNKDEYQAWKRFNIPYLKRTLRRLEKEKLVEIGEEKGRQVVKLTKAGKRRILKYSLDELAIKKPKFWDGKWRLISYDIPKEFKSLRNLFREYLSAWRFYPLHESVFLHAYPCEKEVLFLREYLGIGEYVRIFSVVKIENDQPFKEFFGV